MLQTIIANAPLYLGIILGIWEVVSRAIPTSKDWTVVGNIVKVLQSISDFLNVKKPTA
jgi:hypothetical protein